MSLSDKRTNGDTNTQMDGQSLQKKRKKHIITQDAGDDDIALMKQDFQWHNKTLHSRLYYVLLAMNTQTMGFILLKCTVTERMIIINDLLLKCI